MVREQFLSLLSTPVPMQLPEGTRPVHLLISSRHHTMSHDFLFLQIQEQIIRLLAHYINIEELSMSLFG